jgi:small subunit ribosomal protein S9
MAHLTETTKFGKRATAPQGRKTFVIDVKGMVLGRVASRIAHILKGKHKPDYDTHLDHGDQVVVLNAGQIRLTGRKLIQKETFRVTGYPEGDKRMQYKDLMEKKPEMALQLAVKGMLPKNSLGKHMIKKMKVYRDAKHPHAGTDAGHVFKRALVHPRRVKKMSTQKLIQGTGRRKNSVARVRVIPGTGKITVNGQEADKYFARETSSIIIRMPLEITGQKDKVDIIAKCHGGGISGQAGALRHGIARALVAMDPDNRTSLAKAGMMTRDPRMVERKKYGQPGARKRFQFSKR